MISYPRHPFALRAFGQRLRTLRVERNLTQAQLAKHARLQTSAICHIETGRRAPSLKTLACIADGLGVSLSALFGSEATGQTLPLFEIRALGQRLVELGTALEAIAGGTK